MVGYEACDREEELREQNTHFVRLTLWRILGCIHVLEGALFVHPSPQFVHSTCDDIDSGFVDTRWFNSGRIGRCIRRRVKMYVMGRRRIRMWMAIPAEIGPSTVHIVDVVIVPSAPPHVDTCSVGIPNAIRQSEFELLWIHSIVKFAAGQRFLCFEHVPESPQCLSIRRSAQCV